MNPNSTATQVGVGVGAMGTVQALAGAIQWTVFTIWGIAVNNDQSADLAVLMYPIVHWFYLKLGATHATTTQGMTS